MTISDILGRGLYVTLYVGARIGRVTVVIVGFDRRLTATGSRHDLAISPVASP